MGKLALREEVKGVRVSDDGPELACGGGLVEARAAERTEWGGESGMRLEREQEADVIGSVLRVSLRALVFAPNTRSV